MVGKSNSPWFLLLMLHLIISSGQTTTTTTPFPTGTTTEQNATITTTQFMDAITMFINASSSSTSSTSNPKDEITSNAVKISFYDLSLSKFDSKAFSNLLAEKTSEHCQRSPKECGITAEVTFMASDVISHPVQAARDLDVPTTVRYPNDTSTINPTALVLPKLILSKIILSNREAFRQTVGRDIINVNGQSFRIKADVTNNAVISIVFVILTVILLAVTLILRNNYNDQENLERKEKTDRLRRMEQNSQVYKIRPGPEPIERYPSIKRKSFQKESEKRVTSTKLRVSYNQTEPATGLQERMEPANVNGNNSDLGRLNERTHPSIPEIESASKLPPLESAESRRHEKKKKKSKRRKKEKKEDVERGENMDLTEFS